MAASSKPQKYFLYQSTDEIAQNKAKATSGNKSNMAPNIFRRFLTEAHVDDKSGEEIPIQFLQFGKFEDGILKYICSHKSTLFVKRGGCSLGEAGLIHFMPYYGLFSWDLHVLHLWWRSPLCSLLVILLCSLTHYDITIGHDVARMPHCGTTIGNDVARNIHYDITMDNEVAMCT